MVPKSRFDERNFSSMKVVIERKNIFSAVAIDGNTLEVNDPDVISVTSSSWVLQTTAMAVRVTVG